MEKNQKINKLCDLCQSDANCICLQCICNYYCDSYYKYIHDKKENSSHKKEIIDSFFPIETKCHEHKNNKLNFFCIEEKSSYYNLFIYYSSLLFHLLL